MSVESEPPSPGAIWDPQRKSTVFRVWAPNASKVELKLIAPRETLLPMQRAERGYWELVPAEVSPGTQYLYRLDGERDRPDPASHYQPAGVHGPSEIVHPEFPWPETAWNGIPQDQYVFYELHVGTFTKEGTFAAIVPHLRELRDLGVTCIELMPVAQFPGSRNWGYDGVFPFAVQDSYGGPHELKKLVAACHGHGIAVCLDVVYNHLGPEGNYLWDFAPYFTDRYKTPWGEAINFDGPHSDEVRAYFLANALRWVEEFRIDALRLDAVHAIFDFSAYPFLEELSDVMEKASSRLGRRIHLIAESDLNDTRVIRSNEHGGFHLHAQWSDDFHHALHVLLTEEKDGYYEDFGLVEHLARVWSSGYTYSGQYSAHRKRRHGNDPAALPAEKFVVCSQNHDQVGNRMLGDRLTTLVDYESLKLAAAATILSPHLPLLFMGEEYAEPTPFQYFVSHGDKNLIEGVREGRRKEFAAFHATGTAPDPQSEETFRVSTLDHSLKKRGRHKTMLALYRELLRLRREVPALATLDKKQSKATAMEEERLFVAERRAGDGAVVLLFNFSREARRVALPEEVFPEKVILDTADKQWDGPGSTLADTQIRPGETIPMHPGSAIAIAARATRP